MIITRKARYLTSKESKRTKTEYQVNCAREFNSNKKEEEEEEKRTEK
jgi:hypothetical protein